MAGVNVTRNYFHSDNQTQYHQCRLNLLDLSAPKQTPEAVAQLL